MKKYCLIALLGLVISGCQESLEDRCAREASEYTRKNCPTRIDENTIIDSLTFERATHTVHYYYKLTGVADEERVFHEIDAVGELRKTLKNSTSLKTYMDAGYRFAYTYHSAKNPQKLLFDVVFTEKDYK